MNNNNEGNEITKVENMDIVQDQGNLSYEEALHQLAECDAAITNLIDASLHMEMEAATIMVDMISMNDLLIVKHLEDEELDLVTQIGLKKFSGENKNNEKDSV